ncbi:MAG: STAS domain-containing protein [Oscillochloridaceae bacterium umkhey_bin13]
MDIRLRLLLAFIPLIVLLIGTAVALPFVQQEAQALISRQTAAVESLSDLQVLESYIVREHAAIIKLVDGEEVDEARALFFTSRRGAEELVARRAIPGYAITPLDASLNGLYAALAQRHDRILARLDDQDPEGADDLLDSSETNELLDLVITTSGQARDLSRAQLDLATRELEISQFNALLRAAFTTLAGVVLALLLSWILVGGVVKPLNRLTADAERLAADPHGADLGAPGSISQIHRLRDAFQQLLEANRQREAQLAGSLAEREAQLAREEQLRATVQALSVPVVPLQAATLLLPLVGYLDERRSSELLAAVLEAIHTRRARFLVVDLTGLSMLDQQVSGQLAQLATAARLLGCQVILVGVQADHAPALAEAQLSGSGLWITRDIPSAIARIGAA